MDEVDGPQVVPGTAQAALLADPGAAAPLRPRRTGAEPGWYPSPVGTGWRWFNGDKWTFHTRVVAPADRRRPPPGDAPRWARRRLRDVSASTPTVLTRRSRAGVAAGLVGMLVVLAALGVGGRVGWQLWGRHTAAQADQVQLSAQLERAAPGDARFSPAGLGHLLPERAVPGTAVLPLDTAVDVTAAAAGIGADAAAEPADVWDAPDSPMFDAGTDTGVLAQQAWPHDDIAPWPPAGWAPPAGRAAPVLPADEGAAVGRIRIPSIGVDMVMVAGTSDEALNAGAGVWRTGAFPGAPGNATVAAHRMNDIGFRDINKLTYGDAIYVDVPGHPTAVYEVRGRAIVTPQNVAVAAPTPGVRLSLLSCHPLNSSAYRLVVSAEMVQGEWVDQAVNRSGWALKTS